MLNSVPTLCAALGFFRAGRGRAFSFNAFGYLLLTSVLGFRFPHKKPARCVHLPFVHMSIIVAA